MLKCDTRSKRSPNDNDIDRAKRRGVQHSQPVGVPPAWQLLFGKQSHEVVVCDGLFGCAQLRSLVAHCLSARVEGWVQQRRQLLQVWQQNLTRLTDDTSGSCQAPAVGCGVQCTGRTVPASERWGREACAHASRIPGSILRC
jgi:hypothetical protein